MERMKLSSAAAAWKSSLATPYGLHHGWLPAAQAPLPRPVRQYFHSRSCMPMTEQEAEADVDSDDENDNDEWAVRLPLSDRP